jgi:hypothetical protein
MDAINGCVYTYQKPMWTLMDVSMYQKPMYVINGVQEAIVRKEGKWD